MIQIPFAFRCNICNAVAKTEQEASDHLNELHRDISLYYTVVYVGKLPKPARQQLAAPEPLERPPVQKRRPAPEPAPEEEDDLALEDEEER